MLTCIRGRLSYLLEWAPAKRLRRWISINCPRFFMRLADVALLKKFRSLSSITNDYGKENATWL